MLGGWSCSLDHEWKSGQRFRDTHWGRLWLWKILFTAAESLIQIPPPGWKFWLSFSIKSGVFNAALQHVTYWFAKCCVNYYFYWGCKGQQSSWVGFFAFRSFNLMGRGEGRSDVMGPHTKIFQSNGDLNKCCNSGAEHFKVPENGEIFPAGRKWNLGWILQDC